MPTPQTQPWTVGRLLSWTREHFQAKGVDQPRLSAELLLANAMNCAKIELYTRFEHVPPDPQVARFRELVQRASANAPISYLTGHKEFYSLDIIVNEDVLIPRPETETLVETALVFCKGCTGQQIDILDMGTGSGCIAVAIGRYEPRARIIASDVSDAALRVAADNIARHGLSDRVRTVLANGPALPHEARPPGGFDAIVSNPPYIADDAVESLPDNIRGYEPRLALAAGDGLVLYRRLAAETPAMLRPGGRCFIEIGMGQAQPVRAIFASSGTFLHAGTWRDLAGIERVLGFERNA